MPVVLGGDIEGDLVRALAGWVVAGRTRVGKPKTAQNDDGLLLVRRGTRVLVAVADGTGDSKLGFRASYIGLRCLGEAFTAGASLALSVECAAAAVQADNLAHGLDGVTTLVACVLDTEGVESVVFGDPVFSVGVSGRIAHMSPTQPERRVALGGEPFGDTITSSGRIVTSLEKVSEQDVTKWDGASAVVLGSDGLLLGSPGWGEPDMDQCLDGQTDAMDAVAELVGRSERAIERGAKADNITALVALRAGSDSR